MTFTILIFIISCMASGFFAGLLGIGGGTVLVPLLLLMLPKIGIDAYVMQMALGTSLLCVLFNTSLSARAQYKRGSIDFHIVKYWSIMIVFGAVLGSFWASGADGKILKVVYMCVMASIAICRLINPKKTLFSYDNIHKTGLVFPAVIGWVSATMGMGAGTSAPVISLHGVRMQQAVGTASSLGVFVTIPGVIVYMYTGLNVENSAPYSIGFVNIPMLFAIVPISMLFAPLGVKVSHMVKPETLNYIFCAFSLTLIINMGLNV